MCSHFARCKRFTILVVNRGCGFLGPNMTEYTAALYIPLFVFDACLENNMSLWLTWLWWFFCFFHCSLSYLIRPLSFFPSFSLFLSHPSSLSQYESLYLAYLVWGLSFIYVLLLLSPPSVTSTVPACSFLMAWRKTLFGTHVTSHCCSRNEERKNNV